MQRFVVCLTALVGLAPTWPAAAATVDFAKEIQPILQSQCLSCHGPQKKKGKLRLDSKEAAFKGGKDGVVITAGDAAKSEVYRRITLPKGNDDIMPAEGEPLTKAQTDLIRDWINQGATWPDGLVIAPAASPGVASASAAGPTDPLADLPAGFKPAPGEQQAIAALAKLEVAVRPIAMNVPWTEANFRLQGTNITDAALTPLRNLASLVELNLGRTKVTDAGLANVKGLSNLVKLHLELTAVTDAGLAQLEALPHLRYLNLYGTAVSDAGLEHLKGLKSLREIYLWQTKVTPAGAAALRQALPQLEVSTGWELTTAAKDSKAGEKADEHKKTDAKP